MSRLRQALLLGGVAMVCGLAGFLFYFYQWRLAEGPADPAEAGRKVMAAKLLGVDGNVLPFEQWRGKVLVVNFWATWCTPCREEIPGFIDFQKGYGSKGVQFVGVAIDQKERVAPYAKDMGINYPLAVGGMETMEFARQLGNHATVLPYTVILDRAGKVVASQIGIVRPEKLQAIIAPLL
jgi:thiol-disulfide isomerase/thioredoxin